MKYKWTDSNLFCKVYHDIVDQFQYRQSKSLINIDTFVVSSKMFYCRSDRLEYFTNERAADSGINTAFTFLILKVIKNDQPNP